MKGHTTKINSIQFNKLGTTLASCSKDMIKFWSMESFQCSKTIKAHEHNISAIKFMPSGDQIVSASWDKTIKVWEVATGYLLKTFDGHDGWIMNIDVNAEGTRMVSCTKSQEIIYWDLNLKSDRPILSMFEEEHENIIDVVVFVPLETAKVIIKARMDQENNEDDKEEVGKAEEAETEEEKSGQKEPSSAATALSKRGEELKKAREKLAKMKGNIGNRATKEEEEDEKKEAEPEKEIVVNTEYVASGSRDKRIKIWNAKRGICIMNLIGHDGWVNDIVFHHNGKYLLSASDDKSVRIWDMERNGV